MTPAAAHNGLLSVLSLAAVGVVVAGYGFWRQRCERERGEGS